MARTVDNTEDILDSRDVDSRIDEMISERDALKDDLNEWLEENRNALAELESVAEDTLSKTNADRKVNLLEKKAELEEEIEDWANENDEELEALEAFAGEGKDATSEWSHGETLIRESHFTEYCEQLCEDIGDLPKDMPSYIVIDWEATANNLRQDYSEIDFAGETYLVRSS